MHFNQRIVVVVVFAFMRHLAKMQMILAHTQWKHSNTSTPTDCHALCALSSCSPPLSFSVFCLSLSVSFTCANVNWRIYCCLIVVLLLYFSLAATSAALFFLQILFVAFNYDNNNKTSASRSLTSLRWRHIVFVFALLPVLCPWCCCCSFLLDGFFLGKREGRSVKWERGGDRVGGEVSGRAEWTLGRLPFNFFAWQQKGERVHGKQIGSTTKFDFTITKNRKN